MTAYEGIKGSAVVAAGTATSNDLLARTSFMDINGAGTLGLVEQELDYELDAKLTGSIGIPNCETLDAFVGGQIPFDDSRHGHGAADHAGLQQARSGAAARRDPGSHRGSSARSLR